MINRSLEAGREVSPPALPTAVSDHPQTDKYPLQLGRHFPFPAGVSASMCRLPLCLSQFLLLSATLLCLSSIYICFPGFFRSVTPKTKRGWAVLFLFNGKISLKVNKSYDMENN